MSNGYMTLMGAEEVGRAASRMSSAADTMSSAANSIDGAVEQFRRTWLDVSDELRATRESIDALTAELKATRVANTPAIIEYPELTGDDQD